MRRDEVLTAFRAECEHLEPVLAALDGGELARPSNCPPWTVADLISHLVMGAARPISMLAAAQPPDADMDAVAYFRPAIFTPEANTARVAAAQQAQAGPQEFPEAWRRTYAEAAEQDESRRVVTRHGDHMLLIEFMATRVVELALHGLDLALSLDRTPWTAPSAAALTERILITSGADRAADLGWDSPTLLAKASGRTPLTPQETRDAARLGLTWRPLG
jgi:uncharacterized protein (TIGR03083 family)